MLCNPLCSLCLCVFILVGKRAANHFDLFSKQLINIHLFFYAFTRMKHGGVGAAKKFAYHHERFIYEFFC